MAILKATVRFKNKRGLYPVYIRFTQVKQVAYVKTSWVVNDLGKEDGKYHERKHGDNARLSSDILPTEQRRMPTTVKKALQGSVSHTQAERLPKRLSTNEDTTSSLRSAKMLMLLSAMTK